MSKRGPEFPVEERLKWLEGFGFEVLKLTTPGRTKVMDRMILWPVWSPSDPAFVECKAPGKAPDPGQEHTADVWRKRGCDIKPYVDTEDKAIKLCDELLCEAVDRFMSRRAALHSPPLPVHIVKAHKLACQRLDRAYLLAF